MPHMVWLTVGAAVCAVTLVAWRVWPAVAGRARAKDDPRDRLAKWNRHVGPLIQKTLKGELSVGRGGVFHSRQDGLDHTITTWDLEAAVLPDVEFVRLHRGADKLGVVTAEALRGLLGGAVQSQVMFGHTAWVTVLPQGFEAEALGALSIPAAEFDAAHRVPHSEEDPA